MNATNCLPKIRTHLNILNKETEISEWKGNQCRGKEIPNSIKRGWVTERRIKEYWARGGM